MATIVRGERRPFGPIVNDVSGTAETRQQVGGEGVCRWKMLMNGMHLEGEWNCVEYVVIEPGASVGEHVHLRTEEIYYIVSGHAVVTMDDVELDCAPGDLITTPIGSAHSIANRSDEDMHFFVVEVFPGEGEAVAPMRVQVPDLLDERQDRRRAEVDLTPHFTGDWRRFTLTELPPEKQTEESTHDANTEVLHVLSGSADVTVDGQAHHGRRGLSVAVPPGSSRTVRNAGDGPLQIIGVEVRAR
ncbi:cupin domain-containing protein [Streptomyces atriruber]|uniref:cupin domain-containing protein n=1 Tax=Streptomyces atriruber TaxID=545121 RepID=UPI00099F386F|nr:cupin domain-containing protein [Streptomyces atriruber]